MHAMWIKRIVLASTVFAATWTAGCFSYGPVVWNLEQNSVRPPTLMVATPLPRTLYLVVGADNVPDTIPVRNSANPTLTVLSFQTFFGEALRLALRPYFRSVEIVSEAPAPEAGPCFVADLRIDDVEARDLPIGAYTYRTLLIQWAFAIRPSEATEYTYSFAGSGTSDHAYRTLGEGFEQMTLSAISGLLEHWTDDDVFRRLAEPATAGGEAAESPH